MTIVDETVRQLRLWLIHAHVTSRQTSLGRQPLSDSALFRQSICHGNTPASHQNLDDKIMLLKICDVNMQAYSDIWHLFQVNPTLQYLPIAGCAKRLWPQIVQ